MLIAINLVAAVALSCVAALLFVMTGQDCESGNQTDARVVFSLGALLSIVALLAAFAAGVRV